MQTLLFALLTSIFIVNAAHAQDMASPPNSLTVDDTGLVGVGTDTPNEKVDVLADNAAARFQLTSFTNTGNEAAQFVQRRAGGTSGTPTAVTNGSNLGLFSFRGYTGSGFTGSKALITVQTVGGWSGGSNGTRILFGTTPNGSTTLNPAVMEITHDGKVKVTGTTLDVPDYVFEDDYDLMPLDDLKAYIEKEKHLPNMPTATDIKRRGIDLAGSQMRLLEKIEELTLYTLQQQQHIVKLQDQIMALESRLTD